MRRTLRRELNFFLALWKTNLLAVMEFRAAFLSQVIGMMLNNGVYFVFWVVFFNRFPQVQGWTLSDMFLLFGLVAASFGLSTYFFGNITYLADLIAKGQLDYYLSLPRPVLPHALASRSVVSGLGDLAYGCLSFCLAGRFTLDTLGRFILGVLLSAVIFLAFMVLVQSLAFWMGQAQALSAQVFNAVITLSTYPLTLFNGAAKFVLFTLLPAALIGSLPAEFVRSFTWARLGWLLAAAAALLGLAVGVFYRGLRRYESGSLMQNQL